MYRTSSFIIAAVLLVFASSFVFVTKTRAIDVSAGNIHTQVQNMLHNAANTGNNSTDNGSVHTGNAGSQSVIDTTVNTTVVTCCETPTPKPSTPPEDPTATPVTGAPTPTPTSGSNGGGGNNGGGNGGDGNGQGGGEVRGASREQGQVLGLSATDGPATTATIIQGAGLVCLAVSWILKKRFAA